MTEVFADTGTGEKRGLTYPFSESCPCVIDELKYLDIE